jgi:hypothetical protein
MTTATAPAPLDASLYATPDPRVRARELLAETLQLLEQAQQQVKSSDPVKTAETVGEASDRIGSALYFLRYATRR